MTKITIPSFSTLAGLQIKDDIVMEDIMNVVEMGQFSALHSMEEGLERLKNILLDPGKLKIEIKGNPVTIFETETYYLGAIHNNQVPVPSPWYLNSEEDFEQLKQSLLEGYYLFKKVPEGFAIIVSKDNIEDMTMIRDMTCYWNELVAEFCNHLIQSLTPWHTRHILKPFSRFIDVDQTIVTDQGVIKEHETVLNEVLEDLLEGLISQVMSFVRKDVMAFTVASANSRGIQLTRFANAIALKYMLDLENKRLKDKEDDLLCYKE